MKNAAEEKSPGTLIAPSSSRSAGSTVTRGRRQLAVDRHRGAGGLGAHRGAGGAQHPLGVVAGRAAARSRSVGPSASSPASSTHDFTWALATGSRYSIPRSGAPADRQRRQRPSRDSTSAPISRSGSATRSTGPAADRLVAVERPLARRAGRRASPGSSRSSVPALPTSICRGARRRAGPTPRDPTSSPRRRRARAHRPRRRAARPRSASTACRRRRGSCSIRGLALAHRGERSPRGGRSTCRAAARASRAAARRARSGSSRRRRSRPPRRRGRARGRSRAARSASSAPATQTEIAPVRMSGAGIERHVLDVDLARGRARARSRRRSRAGSRPRSAARAASPPARSDSSRRRRSSPAAGMPARRPRRRRRRGSARRPRSSRSIDRVDPGGDRLAVGGEDVAPDRRVGAGDAGRVAKARSRPPAGARTPRESAAAASPTSTLASTCGRWLTVAITRSCVSGSIACGRAPRSATVRCRRS